MSWQTLCSDTSHACFGGDPDCGTNRTRERTYAAAGPAPEANETNYVEVQPDGTGKLRNIVNDSSLRCKIVCFDRHGEVLFATVKIPPQGDLPGGRQDEISCPCVFRR